MLRDQQERLEERIADVQAQNSKLRDLVNQSNVDTVKAAIKERDAALSRVAEEKQKSATVKKNAKDEIAKVKKQANAALVKSKNQLRFWQVMAVALFGVGIAVGWIL